LTELPEGGKVLAAARVREALALALVPAVVGQQDVVALGDGGFPDAGGRFAA
jgi:hypothetical protein